MTSRVPRGAWWAAAVVLLGVGLRVALLDADPHYYAWIGYLTDEGRWVEFARYYALSGRVLKYHQFGDNLHLLIAPLFQAAHVPLFEVIGISIWAARLPTALCGSAVLVVAYAWLRSRVGPVALFFGIALLASQADLVMLSRVAVPEAAVMLVALGVFALLLSSPGSRSRICLAGALTLLGTGVKANVVGLAPVFAAVLLAVPRDAPRDSWRRRLADAALYLGVALGPLVLAAASIVLAGYPLTDRVDLAGLVQTFVQPAGLFNMVRHPFDSSIAPVLNATCLVAWLGGLAWWVLPRERFGATHRQAILGLAAWSAAYFVPLLAIRYFPHRYQVHVLVPLALLAAVVADVLMRAGPRALSDGLERFSGIRRLAAGAAAACPTGAILAPAAVAATVGFTDEPPRLLVRIAACALAGAAVAVAAAAAPRGRAVWSFLLGFPPVFALTWLACVRSAFASGFWPAGDAVEWAQAWGTSVLVALGIWATGRVLRERVGSRAGPACAALAGATYLSVGLVAVAPAYLSPRYTMRDASRELGRLLPYTGSVASYAAEGLFNDNTSPYRNHRLIDALRRRDDFWVTLFDEGMDRRYRRLLASEYEPLKTWDLYVAPEYFRLDGDPGRTSVRATLYRRRDPAPGESADATRN